MLIFRAVLQWILFPRLKALSRGRIQQEWRKNSQAEEWKYLKPSCDHTGLWEIWGAVGGVSRLQHDIMPRGPARLVVLCMAFCLFCKKKKKKKCFFWNPEVKLFFNSLLFETGFAFMPKEFYVVVECSSPDWPVDWAERFSAVELDTWALSSWQGKVEIAILLSVWQLLTRIAFLWTFYYLLCTFLVCYLMLYLWFYASTPFVVFWNRSYTLYLLIKVIF